MPGDGFEPPTRGFSIRHQIQEKQGASVSKSALTNRELNENVSNADLTGAKENPGSAATETGMDLQDWLSWVDNNLIRERRARALARAVADCDPADRVPFLELLIDGLRQGAPQPLIGAIMAEARDWAAWACRAELKAYCLASYNRMPARDQSAFLEYVQGRAAA